MLALTVEVVNFLSTREHFVRVLYLKLILGTNVTLTLAKVNDHIHDG